MSRTNRTNRAQLKAILKECLEELVYEGAFTDIINESVARYSLTQSKRGNGRRNPSGQDRSLREKKEKQNIAPIIDSLIEGEPSQINRNVLRDILTETASTLEHVDENGFPESAKQPTQKDIEQMKLLESITGEGRWAKIAFGNKK